MNNRQVGLIIISFALLIGFIVYSFNRALTEIVNTSCSHGDSCPMWGTIDFQTNVSIGIIFFVILIGIYFILMPAKKKEIKANIKNLDKDEMKIISLIEKSEGSMFQSAIVEESKYPKTKITRILDRLEGKGVIERKRRGMTNIVLLKK
ncbi:MAG: MarR family transcriptional regulator [Candidatus Nanoarchaeia archaeon]|nr:MarR family transcriptional regulator [Candidatus Nanoarchaeia archaeon]